MYSVKDTLVKVKDDCARIGGAKKCEIATVMRDVRRARKRQSLCCTNAIRLLQQIFMKYDKKNLLL